MSDFINAMSSLFSFFFTQLANFANFFTTNTLGIVILSCILFSLIVYVLTSLISKIK